MGTGMRITYATIILILMEAYDETRKNYHNYPF